VDEDSKTKENIMEAEIPALAAAEKLKPMTLTQRELEVKYNDLAVRFDNLCENYKLLYDTTRKSMRDLAGFFITHEEPR